MSSVARRSLTVALQTPELSPEAAAFLKEGTPKPLVEKSALVAVEDRAANAVFETEIQNDEPEIQKPARQKSVPPKAAEFVAIPGLVFTSLRLPAEIPHALMRASFDRKLKREKPWTQQDIAAEALTLWLKKHGYL